MFELDIVDIFWRAIAEAVGQELNFGGESDVAKWYAVLAHSFVSIRSTYLGVFVC